MAAEGRFCAQLIKSRVWLQSFIFSSENHLPVSQVQMSLVKRIIRHPTLNVLCSVTKHEIYWSPPQIPGEFFAKKKAKSLNIQQEKEKRDETGQEKRALPSKLNLARLSLSLMQLVRQLDNRNVCPYYTAQTCTEWIDMTSKLIIKLNSRHWS